MLVDQGLEMLSEEAAWDLLTQEVVGRVGLSVAALPVILPVNFAVIDGCIVFRTAPGSKLAAAATGAVVAFEVDRHDRGSRSGWSVLVVGRSEVIHELDEKFKVLAAKLEPYVDGIRSGLVRIHPEFVSGRRVVHEEKRAGTSPAIADVVYISDSVEQPFAAVCRALADASCHLPGSVIAVSDSMATLDLGGTVGETTELRVLPLRSGDQAMTELLLISTGKGASPAAHAHHVEGARSKLADIVRKVETSGATMRGKGEMNTPMTTAGDSPG